MNWMECTVLTTTEASDLISQILMDAGSAGTMIEDKNDVAANQRPEHQWDIIDVNIARRIGDDVRVTGYFEADEKLRDRIAGIQAEIRRIQSMDLGMNLGKLETITKGFEEEDWAETWKKSYKTFRLGEHIVIKPGWKVYEAQPGDHVIEIDPGMAFGTGTHETTDLSVQFIEKYVQPGQRVIDIGTGTGILAITAAHMGATSILATDLDEMAVRVAAENVQINGFEDVITVRGGDLLDAVDEIGDVVIANIIADVIKILAKPARKHIADDGLFICSGITIIRQQEVIDALEAANYEVLDILNKGEWAAIVSRKH